MINDRLKKRLKKARPSTTITMRIPAEVVESLKAVAPMRGFTAYPTLLKSYISEGLRRDEARFDQHTARRLADALRRRGVAERVLQEAMKEITEGSWHQRSELSRSNSHEEVACSLSDGATHER